MPQGQNVLDSGQPVSTMKTCGQCHDTDFIASHSFHTDLGLSSISATAGQHARRRSPGIRATACSANGTR